MISKLLSITQERIRVKVKLYDVNLLSKFPGHKCPYEKIEWSENGVEKHINCFDRFGKSKGLLVIAKEHIKMFCRLFLEPSVQKK